MRKEDFITSPSGMVVDTTFGSPAFVPNPLPPRLDISRFLMPLTEAQYRLGELRELGRGLSNPYLLTQPLLRKEAVSSSSMEGTITTLTDLFAFEMSGDGRPPSSETREVHNYVRALDYGISTLAKLPVSRRLLCNVHNILMSGVTRFRGSDKRPGEFRRSDPAWSGTAGTPIQEAPFVFTPPDHVDRAFTDLERFINRDGQHEFPPLVEIALVHYQFETIHPFHDGNGRIGRLLVPLLLHQHDVMARPMLYMSPFFERNKDEYIHSMFEVSRAGHWENWVDFFLRGAADQARDTIIRAHILKDLQTEYRDRLSQARQSALGLQIVDMLFENPMVTIPAAQRRLGVTYHTARNHIEKLVAAGILSEVMDGITPRIFVADEIYNVVQAPIDVLAAKYPVAS